MIFEGVPQFQNENVTEIILSLASKRDVNLTANDISIAHRLPVKRPRLNSESNVTRRHPGIIVRFISRQKRNEMYSNGMKAKNISDFPLQGMNKLFVNENLTQRRKRLFWVDKQKQKNSITSLSELQTAKFSFVKTKKRTVYLLEPSTI